MDDDQMRHGCLTLLVLTLCGGPSATAASPPADHLLLKARTRQFEIAYQVNEDALPLRAVELWYTFDRGQTWHNYGRDEDKASPMSFAAPREGLCGFCFVISNAAGASGPSPAGDTAPHLWTFIDYTPPIVQLHPAQIVRRPGAQTIARLRWTAIDAHLTSRPIDLAYRVLPEGTWLDLKRRLSNSGRYDWHVPPEVSGKVMIRLTVRDRGGHEARTATAAVSINVEEPPEASSAEGKTNGEEPAGNVNNRSAPTPTEAQRARELLRKGRWHQLREEHDLAAARLRDALTLDPQLPEALVNLGGTMYALSKYDAAGRAYELALLQMPTDREALEGLAKTLVALKKYEAAESKLLTIVKHRPNDVEAWLHLGDVAIYRGDEVGARDYYVKAAMLEPEAASVVARAQARLEDLPSLSHRYREGPTP